MRGHKYSATQDRLGNWTIVNLWNRKSVYLQGNDAEQFTRETYAALERVKYPSGPFQTAAEHIDVVLDAYEEVMQ